MLCKQLWLQRSATAQRGRKKPALAANANVKTLTAAVTAAKVGSAPFSKLGAHAHALALELEPQTQAPMHAPPSSIRGAPPPKKSRKQHRKDRKKLIRAAEAQKAFVKNTDAPRSEALKAHLGSTQTATASLNAGTLPANSSGYEANFKDAMGSKVLNYDELIAEGYELIEWDGMQVALCTLSSLKKNSNPAYSHRKPLILSAADTETVFAVGVAKPAGDPTYEDACEAAAALLLECGATGGFTQAEIDENLRGPGFMALSFGIGAGHGPPEPYNLCTKHPEIVDRLRSSAALERLAQHHSGEHDYVLRLFFDSDRCTCSCLEVLFPRALRLLSRAHDARER